MTVTDETEKRILDKATYVEETVGVLARKQALAEEEYLARREQRSIVERMKEAAGFRNVLAHNYGEDIDDELVYRTLQTDLDWFPAFLRDVRSFLN